jgi:hypothetical protein
LLADHDVVLATLKDGPLPKTTAGFARSVVAQAAPPAARIRPATLSRRAWWALGTLAATAAAVLLVVSVVWQARQGTLPFTGTPLAGTQPEVDPQPAPIAPPQVRRERGSNAGGLALGQADWLIEAPRLPSRIRGSYHTTIDNLAVTLPETVQRLDEVEHYAPGIKPIRISLGVVLEALWRTLPGNQDDERSSGRRPTRTGYRPIDLQCLA